MKKHFFLIIVSTGISLVANAQVFKFTAKQCVDYALQHNTNVLNAQLDEQIAKAKVNEIIGAGLPQINGSFEVQKFVELPTSVIPENSFFPGSPRQTVQFGLPLSATAGSQASQLIFDPSYMVGLQASKAFVELSHKSAERSKIETVAAVRKAYYMVLTNRERMKLLDANIERLSKLQHDTKALFETGFVEKIDLDRIQLSLNNVTVEKEKIGRLVELSLFLLKYQAGIPQNAVLELSETLSSINLSSSEAINDSVRFEYKNRIEYGLMESQLKLKSLNLRNERFRFIPTIAAYATLNAQAFRYDWNFGRTDMGWYPVSVIGGKISLPIWGSGQRTYRVQQTKMELQKTQNDFTNLKNAIDLELLQSKTQYLNSLASMNVQKKNKQLAEEVYRVSKLKYEQGLGSNLEVVTAESDLKEAQTNYYDAVYQVISAKIDLEKANGTILY